MTALEPPHAVLFDWAGTLVDHGSRAPVLALLDSFAAAGVSLTEDEARTGMGLAKRAHLSAIAARPAVAARWQAARGEALNDRTQDRLYADLEARMGAAALTQAAPLPGISLLMARLAALNIPVGSTTGYPRAVMDKVAPAAAGQGCAPAVVICPDDVPKGRPAPFMVWLALIRLGIWPAARVWVVDDSEVGVRAAAEAGCVPIGITLTGTLCGQSAADLQALSPTERDARHGAAAARLRAAGARHVCRAAADLLEDLPPLGAV